jgi:2-oxoglutarate ferredoxin oxidoreductase subunit beta
VSESLQIEQFLHTERLPHIWCPGCGIGIVTGAFLRAVVDLGLEREKTVVVGGIGCSSRAVGYIDLGTVHAIHGRALAFATGIKMARPDFTVVVLTGDGDGAAIGGNHLIHACRRNIDITCILFNNQTYGMTGGQASPTMDLEDRAATAPYGQVEPAFDLCRLAQAAGATFVARGTAANIRPLERLIRQGIEHKGFSFIEAVVPCPTEYGKRNPPTGAVAMLEDAKARSVTVTQAAKMPVEALAGKIVTGILHDDSEAPEFQATYAAVVARAQAAAAAGRKARPRRVEAPPVESLACGLPADLLTAASVAQAEATTLTAEEEARQAEARPTSEPRSQLAPAFHPTPAVEPPSSPEPPQRSEPAYSGEPPVEAGQPPDAGGLPCEGGE